MFGSISGNVMAAEYFAATGGGGTRKEPPVIKKKPRAPRMRSSPTPHEENKESEASIDTNVVSEASPMEVLDVTSNAQPTVQALIVEDNVIPMNDMIRCKLMHRATQRLGV